jgi:hypothetical protein
VSQARRTRGGAKPDDIPGEFTIVAVPGTHRQNKRPGRHERRNGSNRLTKAQKQKLLLEGRIRGLSWREAAKQAGYKSVSGAYEAAQEAIADIPREAADEARALEMQRLDEIIRANWNAMRIGDRDASFVILKAIENRRRMLGLDLSEPDDAVRIDVQLQELIVGLVTLPPEEFELREAEMSKLFDASQRGTNREGRTARAIASGE